jgi:tetratricopeptide (TPR) repeat protein
MLRALAAVAALLVFLLATSVALAQKASPESRRAKALFEEGIALSDEGKWAEALEAFQKSDELVPSPTVKFNIAATLRALGRYVESKDVAEQIMKAAETAKPPLKPQLVADVKKLLADVYDKIVALTVKLDPPDAKLAIDGAEARPLADGRLELDPGRHVFVVSAPGYETTTITKTLSADDTELTLMTPKTEAPRVVERRVPGKKEGGGAFYESAWFWSVTGAVIAGAVVVTVLVTRPDEREPKGPPTASVDRVIPAGGFGVRF